MKATRTYNTALVREIMLRPEIFATVAEDDADPADYQPDLVKSCWLVITDDDGELMAIYVFHRRNAVTYEAHPVVLPEHRKCYSDDTGRVALTWLLDNVIDCQKVTALVPALYPNARDFGLRMGFQIEGTNRKSYLKHAQLHDQWHLGITRQEAAQWVT